MNPPTGLPSHSAGGVAVRCVRFIAVGFAAVGLWFQSTIAAEVTKPAEGDLFERCVKILQYGDMLSVAEPTKIDAVHALGLLKDERALPLLVAQLENASNQQLRVEIVRTLAWFDNKTVVPILEKCLADPYPHLRPRAAFALKKLTGKDYDYDRSDIPTREQMKEKLRATLDRDR